MQQNYDFPGGYGASLVTRAVPDYGTLNPGPAAVEPLMGGAMHGEMMGTASDGSSLASYAPVVHAMQVKLPPVQNTPRFMREGTVVALAVDSDCVAAANCDTQDKYVAKAYANKDACQDTTVFQTACVVVSGASVHDDSAVMLSMALQSTVTVQLDTVERDDTETWAAGDLIYVAAKLDQGHLALQLTNKFPTSTYKKVLGRALLPCAATDTTCLLCLVPC